MNYSFYDFLKLLGSLAFFLFGMKLMSESLQKVAGDRMRSILGKMTSNRFRGVLTGILITAIIQSSSATTVMVVSFVNAGLLSLIQSIGVIMGANIGTTVTAWIISLLGFKVDMSVFALPLIGLSMPLIFSSNNKKSSWGEFIVGFAIIFIGLSYLKHAVPDIKSNPEIFEFFSAYSSKGFWSILLFLGLGLATTLVIQSSSAAMALTLVMTYNGWIDLPMSAAMVMGQNIGTTITANLAALVANKIAKQAAMAHLIFNLVGVLIILIVFNPFMDFVLWISSMFGISFSIVDGAATPEAQHHIPIILSIYHTIFNVLNTLLLIWFVPQLAKMVQQIVKTKDETDDHFELKYIKTGLVSVSEMSVLQVKQEISLFIERTQKMYGLIKELYIETKPKKIDRLLDKISRYENNADLVDVEIADFLTKISRSDISGDTSEANTLLLRLVGRIESINDSCYSVGQLIQQKKESRSKFTEDMDAKILNYFERIDVIMESFNIDLSNAASIEIGLERTRRDEIDVYTEKLNLQHLKDIKKGTYKYKVGIIYSDLCAELNQLSNHVYHALKYISDLKK